MQPLIKWNKSCCIYCIYISLDLQLMMSPPLTWTAQVLFCFQKWTGITEMKAIPVHFSIKSTQTQDLDTKLAQKFSFHLIQMINFHVQHTTDLCMWNRRASHYNIIKFMSFFLTFFPNQILCIFFVKNPFYNSVIKLNDIWFHIKKKIYNHEMVWYEIF